MTNIAIENELNRNNIGGDAARYLKATGTGTAADPWVQETATRDAGPAWTSAYLHVASADASSGADATAAPATGQKIVVDDIIVSTGASALTVTFEEETSGTDVFLVYLPVNGAIHISPRGKVQLPTANKKLRVKTSGAGAVACTVCYHSEA